MRRTYCCPSAPRLEVRENRLLGQVACAFLVCLPAFPHWAFSRSPCELCKMLVADLDGVGIPARRARYAELVVFGLTGGLLIGMVGGGRDRGVSMPQMVALMVVLQCLPQAGWAAWLHFRAGHVLVRDGRLAPDPRPRAGARAVRDAGRAAAYVHVAARGLPAARRPPGAQRVKAWPGVLEGRASPWTRT